MEVTDIFTELSDGKILLKLLEILSGSSMGQPSNGRLRLHKMENVNRCLHFINQHIKLESIGSEDIIDGNQKLILGLIWSIIQLFHFTIADDEVDYSRSRAPTMEANGNAEQSIDQNSSDHDNNSDEFEMVDPLEPGQEDFHSQTTKQDDHEPSMEKKRSIKELKDALLSWCQKRTINYKNIKITNFTKSWRDGMAFNALIHSYKSNLIDYDSLNPDNHIENLNNAFKVAHEHLNISPLLDAEDVDIDRPDELSILTYVSSYQNAIGNEPQQFECNKNDENLEEIIEPKVIENVENEPVITDKESIDVVEESILEHAEKSKIEDKTLENEENYFLWVVCIVVIISIILNMISSLFHNNQSN